MTKKRKLIIFSAPSASGKSTLVNYVMSKISNLELSISACTRSPRKEEIHGKDYYFINEQEFKNKIYMNEFIEWQEVYKNNFYGTLKSEITRIWNRNNNIIFDIDVKGAINLKNNFGSNALSIFVKVSSKNELKKRLIQRSTENNSDIDKRVSKINEELNYEKKFDIILRNDDLNLSKKNALEIVNNFLND